MRRPGAAQKSHVPFCVTTCVEAIIAELAKFCTNKLLFRLMAQCLPEGRSTIQGPSGGRQRGFPGETLETGNCDGVSYQSYFHRFILNLQPFKFEPIDQPATRVNAQ